MGNLSGWGYPAFDTAVGPAFSLPTPMVQGMLAGQVLGLTGYAMFDNGLYTELGAYAPLSQNTLNALGAGGAGFTLTGLAPYARVAYSHDLGSGTLMTGVGLMVGNISPTDPTQIGSDHYTDLTFDAQYDYSGSNFGLMLKARDIIEWQRSTGAPFSGATNANNTLNAIDISLTYYKPKWAIIGSFASVSGSSDAGLYGANSATNSPNGSSVSLEVNYSPFMDGAPGYFKTSNVKFGAKFTHYLSLYGGSSNFNGTGTNAADNDNLFLYTVIAF